ncbi:hypothetical protein SYNPS1DRAFT_23034 [Syncephalis pseudoplumigaleata]|uniref:Chitin-binding type-4 domain-containing protein n=1 Tax=Syncephalis pseudoplumigaleata TaxID=1712513 RepID=A0A4P9YYA1_9FUNG|nr:hypothetical protein SYNPS1DRAFT_23034 [Syncephalis pseudoplumigaleata]|eukprot:RKP24928.1 hypothetical protein SYNPS1DRAFT_23034 [Syncephalis pseudoplumigaleata]
MRALTSIAVSTLCVVAAVQRVAAHGYLVWPPPLGYEKVTYNEDALKAPTSPDNICRGEPIGNEATPVGHQLVLKFKPTAPHIGPCQVFIMNDDHSNPIHVGNKTNCAAPGVDPTWSITLPAHIRGNKLLRWTWEGCHVTPCEHYEQCAPIIIGGGAADSTPSHDDGYGSSPQPKPKPKPITDVPVWMLQ